MQLYQRGTVRLRKKTPLLRFEALQSILHSNMEYIECIEVDISTASGRENVYENMLYNRTARSFSMWIMITNNLLLSARQVMVLQNAPSTYIINDSG